LAEVGRPAGAEDRHARGGEREAGPPPVTEEEGTRGRRRTGAGDGSIGRGPLGRVGFWVGGGRRRKGEKKTAEVGRHRDGKIS